MSIESLYLDNLGDLCDFIFHQKIQPDPYQCLILRTYTGKVNINRTIFGRAVRYVDARLFPMGALAFYLHVRFMVTKEYKKLTLGTIVPGSIRRYYVPY